VGLTINGRHLPSFLIAHGRPKSLEVILYIVRLDLVRDYIVDADGRRQRNSLNTDHVTFEWLLVNVFAQACEALVV
jgi:hypothetical protein